MKKKHYNKLPTRLDNGDHFVEYELVAEDIHKDVDTGKDVVIKRTNQYIPDRDKASIIKEYKDGIKAVENASRAKVAELKKELAKHERE